MAARVEDATPEPMDVDDMAPPGGTADKPSPAPPWAILSVDASTARPHVDAFLHRFPPSQCSSADVAWILIIRSYQPVEQGDPHMLVREWQWLCRHGDASAAELDRLARVYHVLSGKWMVFCPTAQVDKVWQSIAYAVAAGWLGPSAKVSPRTGSGDGDSCEHVICVYVASYLDREAVQRVRDGLRQLGHVTALLFKPDVFTHCGIYKNNPWGIATHIFSE